MMIKINNNYHMSRKSIDKIKIKFPSKRHLVEGRRKFWSFFVFFLSAHNLLFVDETPSVRRIRGHG